MTEESTLIDASIFPRLVVKVGGRVIQEVELRAELRIGRAEDNDLDLGDPKISRHHARVYREGATYAVADLGSANGTRLNGALLSGPQQLKHGDRIVVGDTELIYQEPGRASDETLIVPAPASAAEQPTVTRAPGLAVPPPRETALPPVATPEGGGKGLAIGLIIAGAVLILAIVVAGVYLLAPGLFGQIKATVPPTQTPQYVVATTVAPAETAEPVGTPVVSKQTSVPVATPTGQEDLGEMLAQAETLARRSKFEEATALYEEMAQQAPDDARPEIGWAWALIWDDEAEEAVLHGQRASEIEPESAAAAAVLARAYIGVEDKAEALVEAQRAVDLDGGSAVAHAVLAEALMINGQTQNAVDAADLALVQDINSAEAHRIRGWLYHIVDNDMGRAAGELQIAAGLQPELWLRRHELGLLLLKAEDYTTAIMAFQDALGIRPKAVTYTAIGEAYYRLGQYDQAKASLQQAVAVGADDLNTYALLGATLAHLGRCDEAKTYYDQALEMDATESLAQEATDLCEGAKPSATPSPTTVSASIPTAVSPPGPSATPRPTSPPQPPRSLTGRIAFPVWNRQRGNYDVYVANVDGSGRKLVVDEMHQPAFSPDGKWLAVNGERHEHMNIFIVQPNGSGLKEVTDGLEDALPCWSPDGESLAFSSTKYSDRQSRVFVIDEVPFIGRQQKGRPLNSGLGDVRGEYPAWTPGEQIVYKGCDSSVEPAKCGLFIMPAASGAHSTTQITESPQDTAPAAYGSQIAFMSNREGNWEIYLMNDDGSGVKRLTNNAADDGLPAWSPDGRAIAFVSNQGGAWAVWAMSPDGVNRGKLFDIGNGGLAFSWQQERISWAP
jgi:tetratricopeptide (TPR) repeat protein